MIVFKDGGWQHSGYIPSGLRSTIDGLSSRESSHLKACSLGPDGEYYLSLNSGRAWWKGSEDMSGDIERVSDRITSIVFGPDGSYFARYN